MKKKSQLNRKFISRILKFAKKEPNKKVESNINFKKLIEKFNIDFMIASGAVNSLQKKLANCDNCKNKKCKRCKGLRLELTQKKTKQKNIQKSIKKVEVLEKIHNKMNNYDKKIEEDDEGVKDVFVTFARIKDAKYFEEKFKKTLPLFFQEIFCCKKNKAQLYAKQAPSPININWRNYSYSFRNKFFRRVLSWFIYSLLYLIRIIFCIILI